MATSCRPTTQVDESWLTGKVYRGPVTPVCQVNVPCNAPFAATFEVRLGGRVVATFTSAADGSFGTAVPAGDLTVTPTASAPVIDPASQVKSVTVPPMGTASVEFFFDTGIR